MQDIATKTIREIALETPATTHVFEKFKIDYCCGGNRSIADACTSAGIDTSQLIESIDHAIAAQKLRAEPAPPEQLKPADLVGYIVATHHVFTSQEIERLTPLMAKVVMRHGDRHPELFELQNIFAALTDSLIPHMRKEENVLFPYIEELERAARNNLHPSMQHFGTVKNPIRIMMAEHDADGERLRKMREITSDYTLPDGGCPSFTALYSGLEDLERDLHRHIHLENNVLFPAAAELEAR